MFKLSLFTLLMAVIVSPFLLCSQETPFLLDSTRVLGPAFSWQERCKLSFNGSQFFLSWIDQREMTLVNPSPIYGARIDGYYSLIDTAGSRLLEGPATFLASASDSTNFLIVKNDLVAQIFDPNGNPVCAPFQISPYYRGSTIIDATFGGGSYFVVWQGWDGTNPSTKGTYGARIAPDGAIIDTNAIKIDTTLNLPSVGTGDNKYFVAWPNGSQTQLYGRRLTYDGVIIDTNMILIASSTMEFTPYLSVVGFGGSLWFIAFQSGFLWGGIFGVRLDLDGNVLDPQPIVISHLDAGEGFPSVSYDGINFGVFYSDGVGYLFGKFIDTSGQIVQSCQVSPLNYTFQATSLFDGTNYMIAYYGAWDVYTAQVQPDGSVIQSDILATYSSYGQENQRADFDGENYLVVWEDRRNSPWYPSIYGARVGRDGTICEPQGIGIAVGETWFSKPDVCFNGANHLVAWQEGWSGMETTDLRGTRITPEGTILDDIPIATGSTWNEEFPSIASDGNRYLVTFTSDEGNFYIPDIMGILIDSDGSIISPGRFPITSFGDDDRQCLSSVCYGDSIYLVAWKDERNSGAYGYPNIYAARVSTAGTVLDYGGFAITATQNTWRMYYVEPSGISFDGTNFLIAWPEKRPEASDWDIYGCRVSPDGTVLDPTGLPIYTGQGSQREPSVIFNGINYVIFFLEDRWENGNIFGVEMTPDGVITDSFLVDYPGAQHCPCAAIGSENQVFLTYTGFLEDNLETMRIWGMLYPPIGIEEETALRPTPHVLSSLVVHPSLFSGQLRIPCSVGSNTKNAKLVIYNTTGRVVKSFALSPSPTALSIVWHGTDDQDRVVPAGIYFVQLEADGYKNTEKVILLR